MLAGLVEGRLAEKHLSAEQALGEACEEVCGMFAALDDDYLRGRTDDVRDVCARIGRVLSGETAYDPFAGLAPGTIVVADELAPSDTAQMDFGRGGARKRDEPCRDHRPEQGHRGAGRRCRVHAAGQNRRPADNRRGAGRTDRRPRSGYRTQIRRAARIAAPGCVPLRGGCTGARRHARRAADHGAGQCRERRRSATRARCRRRGHRTFPERVPLHAGPGASRRRDAVCGIPCRCGALRGTSADCTDT